MTKKVKRDTTPNHKKAANAGINGFMNACADFNLSLTQFRRAKDVLIDLVMSAERDERK